VITRRTLVRRSLPICVRQWAVLLTVVGALVLLGSCGNDLDTSAGGPTTTEVAAATVEPRATEPPATGSPATAERATETPIGADCLAAVAAIPEQDRAAARRLTDAYTKNADRCPDAQGVQELLYIWVQNQEYWMDFPAQEERFFDANVGSTNIGVRPELVGLPVDVARANIIDDAAFPMVQDSGPTVVYDMTMYEFSGGVSVLLVVTREGVVSSVYLFDQT
jgi:hypothetical protein